jgi:hypothetical protein
MSDFEQRLENALSRGAQARNARASRQAAAALSDEELKRLHARYRLELTETIEQCLTRMADHMPGFTLENVVGNEGWGAAIRRDDLSVSGRGTRENLFSRLEFVVRPANAYHVLDLAAKGVVRNKEIFHRDHYQKLAEADPELFRQLIQQWGLDYAELYTAQG